MENFSKKQLSDATRLANEMASEGKGGGNVHIAEERGYSVDDSGMTEEERWEPKHLFII